MIHTIIRLVSDTSCIPLDQVFASSDVITLHCPLFPETEGIINKDTISRMKDGVMITNNSRGPLIVEADLRDALNSKKVAGAAVDVVSTEPISWIILSGCRQLYYYPAYSMGS